MSAAFTPTEHPHFCLPKLAGMDVDTIPNLLADLSEQAPDEVQRYYLNFEDLWERKLWHELTDTLLEFFKLPESASQRLPLFNTFIKSFADKINSLKLVQLGLSAATQCKGRLRPKTSSFPVLTLVEMTRSA